MSGDRAFLRIRVCGGRDLPRRSMPNEPFVRGMLELMRDLAVATDGAPTRCRRLALGLYSLADRMGIREEKLARRLRREARRLGCPEPGGHKGEGRNGEAPLPPRHARVL